MGLCGESMAWGLMVVLAQARVRELEEQCRSQTERFSLLAQELQAFRLHPGPLDLLTSVLGCSALGDHPPPPCCSTPQPCRGSGPKGKVDPMTLAWNLQVWGFCMEQSSGSEKSSHSFKAIEEGQAVSARSQALMGQRNAPRSECPGH